jgi:hypothetical protein
MPCTVQYTARDSQILLIRVISDIIWPTLWERIWKVPCLEKRVCPIANPTSDLHERDLLGRNNQLSEQIQLSKTLTISWLSWGRHAAVDFVELHTGSATTTTTTRGFKWGWQRRQEKARDCKGSLVLFPFLTSLGAFHYYGTLHLSRKFPSVFSSHDL